MNTAQTMKKNHSESKLWLWYGIFMTILLSVVYVVAQASNAPFMN